MARNKMNAIIALSISCNLLLSQVAMAETSSSVATTGASVTATATTQQVQEKQPDKTKTNISKEEATKIIKAFKFAKGLKVTNIYLENNYGINQPVWRIVLYSSKDLTTYYVVLTANTGELFTYNSYQKQSSKKNIITITQKKAKEIADKFLSDNNIISKSVADKLLADNIQIDTKDFECNTYPISGGAYGLPQYIFTYPLKVNGIRTSGINYTVSINATNGKISYFYPPDAIFIHNIKYPTTKGIKDQNQLRDKYISLLSMQLKYRITYDDNYKAKAARLDYIPTTAGWLDAKTMDTVDTDYINYYGNVASLTNRYVPISPDAKIEKKAISEKNAQKIIANVKSYIESLCGFKFVNNPHFSQSTADKEVSSYYDLVNDNKNYGLSMSLNLSTGNIRKLEFTYQNYNNDTNISNKKQVVEKVNYKAAKKISDEIIKNLFVKQYGVFSDNNQEPYTSNEAVKEQQNHIFQYTRYENGVPTDNTIRVCIDKETGKPSSVSMSWNDIDFPKADKVISAQAAKEAFLNYIELTLEYYTPQISRTEALDKAEESVIVFKPHDNAMNAYIDASIGKIVDYLGIPIQAPYVDEKHWAANNIDMLEAQGVSINSISNCDENLSKQDAVKMFSQVKYIMGLQYIDVKSQKKDSFSDMNKENEYYKYIESAVKNGIIKATGKKFNGTQKITKGEYIVMLLDMLGYKESNINKYVSKCKALAILPVKPGDKFNSNDTISFAEAAYSLQKALKYFK